MKIVNKIFLKRVGFILASVIIVVIIFSLGVYLGISRKPEIEKVVGISNKTSEISESVDFGPFWKAWNVLNEKSIHGDEITNQDRVWGAIQGLASSFDDPYTTFFPPDENKSFQEEIKGSFGGIGAEIGRKDNIITIIAPLRDTPAWRAGVKSGDKVVEIDGKNTMNMSADEAVLLIRGEEGTTVKLTLLRNGEKETRTISIVREKINIPTIDTELREDGIFVISFYHFSENATRLFRDALLEFVESKSNKLILDLRGNPGGYLDSAIRISSWFIDKGQIVLSEKTTDEEKVKNYRSYGPRLFNDKLSFVVLVDKGSASASEILAGALKSYGLATLVGEKTYGKGSVQELVKITEDTSLKVTVANWLTPDGVSISKQGLTPDVEVKMNYKDVENNKDPQLEKAVEILLNK